MTTSSGGGATVMARALVALIIAGMVAAFLWAHWYGYEGLFPGRQSGVTRSAI